jgi:hypothetical protein
MSQRLVRLPRTSPRGQPRNYAQLILDFNLSLTGESVGGFSGKIFKCGSTVDEAELWPTSRYPVTPLLLEYAGSDRSGWGHRRSKDIHILWRYAGGGKWDEIARTLSEGPEWFTYFAFIVKREMVRPEIDHAGEAREASARLCALIDGELAPLAAEGRARTVSFLYNEIAARFAQYVVGQSAIYGGAESLRGEVPGCNDETEIVRIPPGRALTSAADLSASGEDEIRGAPDLKTGKRQSA